MSTSILQLIGSDVWAITEMALDGILQILEQDASLIGTLRNDEEFKKRFHLDSSNVGLGEPMAGTYYASVRDGIGILKLLGPVFPRANLFTDYSGATSAELFANDFQHMMNDASIKGIALYVDSPGGQITGIQETSDLIHSARGIKPVKSYSPGMSASAAYWIPSAAIELWGAPTSLHGSIGVVSTYVSYKEKDTKDGIKTIEIVSSISPKKRMDPESDEGRQHIQDLVDASAKIFVNSLSRNRGISEETIIKNYGRGAVMIASDALQAGLIDKIGSFEDMIQSMAATGAGDQTHYKGKGLTMSVTVQEVKDGSPQTYQAIFDAGKADGVKEGTKAGAENERLRIQGIAGIKAPGFEAHIAESMLKPEATKESVALEILAKQEEKRTAAAAGLKKDGEALADQAANIGNAAAPVGADGDDTERAAAAKVMAMGANGPERK